MEGLMDEEGLERRERIIFHSSISLINIHSIYVPGTTPGALANKTKS